MQELVDLGHHCFQLLFNKLSMEVMNVNDLSLEEMQKILSVIQRDEQLRRLEEERLS